jgi:hypothetical protein
MCCPSSRVNSPLQIEMTMHLLAHFFNKFELAGSGVWLFGSLQKKVR